MKNSDFRKQLEYIWAKAVALYEQGMRNPEDFFDSREIEFLTSIGVRSQEVYDFVEDFVTDGEPDLSTFVEVHDIRRHYFQEVQQSDPGAGAVEIESYPDPNDGHDGIDYLPRIAKKARTKLDGSINSEIMYSCRNDRRFLDDHDICPAEFLGKVEETDGDLDELAIWIQTRSPNVGLLI